MPDAGLDAGASVADPSAYLPPAPPPAPWIAPEQTRCTKAKLVLAHLRRRHAETREAHAEQMASEAMERLTRAFVLLCMLRIVIAQQQRRRFLMERAAAAHAAAAWQPARDENV